MNVFAVFAVDSRTTTRVPFQRSNNICCELQPYLDLFLFIHVMSHLYFCQAPRSYRIVAFVMWNEILYVRSRVFPSFCSLSTFEFTIFWCNIIEVWGRKYAHVDEKVIRLWGSNTCSWVFFFYRYTHFWWHIALCELEQGTRGVLERVIEIYDTQIWNSNDTADNPQVSILIIL